jgi:biopolymer transport protein ExbD
MARALRADINITPLIDIVLVLLIVFIVLVPVLARQHPAVLPSGAGAGAGLPLVLTLLPGGAMRLQQEELGPEALVAKLAAAFAGMDGKARKVVLAVDSERPFQETVRALDLVRAASDRCKRPGDDDARVAVVARKAP